MSQQSVPNEPITDIGEVLRQAREEKGMSVASAAMHTNLRKDIIEKLEDNQFSDIGAPVFTRGYLHIYARFLEVDEELIAREFASASKQRREQSLRINSANVESQGKPYRRSMARGWISLIVVLLIGGGLVMQLMDDQSWLMQQIRGTFSSQPTDISESVVVDDDATTPEFTVEVADDVSQRDIPELTSIENLSDDALSSSNDAVDGLSLSSLDGEDSNTALANDNLLSDEQVIPVVPPVTGKATLHTNQENWIEIKDKNGKTVSSKIYKSGANIELESEGGPYRLNIGRPNAISLTVNGQDKPLADYRSGNQTRIFNLSIPNE